MMSCLLRNKGGDEGEAERRETRVEERGLGGRGGRYSGGRRGVNSGGNSEDAHGGRGKTSRLRAVGWRAAGAEDWSWERREKGAVPVPANRIGRDRKGAGLWGLVGNEACDVTQAFLGGRTVICWFGWGLECGCLSVAVQGCVSAAV